MNRTLTVMAGCLLACATSAQAQTGRYTLIPLDLGGISSGAEGLNATGKVTGDADIGNTLVTHAFAYDGSSVHDLGTLGGSYSYGNAINDAGQVAGSSQVAPNQAPLHAFLYSGGTMADLGTLGGSTSYGRGINGSGQVVGDSDTSGDAAHHAFVAANGTMSDLGTLGATYSYGFGINDAGQVTGFSQIAANGAEHAFIDSQGVMSDLGTLGGLSRGQAINDLGAVAGYSVTGSGDTHAFLYSTGAMTDLGTLAGLPDSFARGINDVGQVVGVGASADNNTLRAFLYRNGQMFNLNDLIDPQSGWVLLQAQAINDQGQIVGAGLLNGKVEAFLMTPTAAVPEPSSSALVLAGLVTVAMVFRDRRRPRVHPDRHRLL